VTIAQMARDGAITKSGHSIHRVQCGKESGSGQSWPNNQPSSNAAAGIAGGIGNFLGSVVGFVFMTF
jgi:hypothetical protein